MTDASQQTATVIAQLKDLHREGQYLDAYELTQDSGWGPFKTWTDPDRLLIGGRLAHNLGSERLGRIMHRVAFKAKREDPEIVYFYTLNMSHHWRPLKTWERMTRFDPLFENADTKVQSDWFALRCDTLSHLRDFEMAERWMNKALDLHPERSWLHIMHTSLLDRQDKKEEALEAARKAFNLHPWYRPAIQNLAHRLVQANRDDEAFKLLREGCERTQSGDVRLQLGALLLETEQYEEAREVYAQLKKYHPLLHMDHKREGHLHARRADAAYFCNDFPAALEHAKKADSPFYKALAENLANNNGTGKRVRLPVKFVAQHHNTCAPATLSSIAGYWEKDVEQIDVVEEICLDGTPSHSQRLWAVDNGYAVREFRVTLDVAVKLIDRGVPFTLATVDPGSAHLQAVSGYDTYRASLIIRDPGERHYNEFPLEKMLEHYAPSGPRGMAMVPVEKGELFEGIEFPEAELYDLLHETEVALAAHKRDEAAATVDKMNVMDGDHRITLTGRKIMAVYDGNQDEMLAVTNRLLEKYPEDVNTQLMKVGSLTSLDRRDERRELFEELIANPKCDPLIWSSYGQELSSDAREHDRAIEYLRRAIRHRPDDSRGYTYLAQILLEQQEQDRAISLYRFGACLSHAYESPARDYFFAARVRDQEDKVLRFMKDRFERFGDKLSLTTQTFSWGLEILDRTSEAMNVLQEGYKLRPDDGELLLYFAMFCSRYGKLDEAQDLLSKAEGKCSRLAWLRTHGILSTRTGDLEAGLKSWQEVVKNEPLDIAAQNAVAELLADTQGQRAAVNHLSECVERFPHSYAMRRLLIDTLRGDDVDRFRSHLEKSVELYPNDIWGLHELALERIKNRAFDKAHQLIDHALVVEPKQPISHYLRGRAAAAQQNVEESREHYRNALRQSIDYDIAILALMATCESRNDRQDALEFIYRELQSQPLYGDGLLAYREFATGSMEPETLLQRLQDFSKRRPGLWQAWSARIRQLSDMQQHDEAIKLAKRACDQFPLLTRLWMDRANAHAAAGDLEGEVESLIKAKEISPSWSEPAQQLSDTYMKQGDLQKAREEIERVMVAEPRDVQNHGRLAGILWKQNENQKAVDLLVDAVEIAPGYSWGWTALRAWAGELQQREMVIGIARDLTKKKPNDYRAWLNYAEMLGEREEIDKALNALDKAIKLSPTNPDAYNQKAAQLAHAGRFDEAIKATRPAALKGNPSLELKSRAAAIEVERGNTEKGIKMMEAVVEQDRDYFWAWHRLAEWYEFSGNMDSYHRAVKEMARIEPQNPVPWGYLGDSELRKKNRDAAKKHFEQAVNLSPAYSYGSGQLVELLLEDKEYDRALGIIDLTAPHTPPAWTLSEKIRISTMKKERDVAFNLLRELAITPAEDSMPMDKAVESLFMAGWGEQAKPLIDELLQLPDAQPGVAYVYVNLSATLKTWDQCQKQIDQMKDRPLLWKEGTKKFLEEMATADDQSQLPRFHAFIKKRRKTLHGDIELWTATGDAYNSAGLYDQSIKWMGDWRSRQGITADVCYTVAWAKWQLRRPHDAIVPTRFAFENLAADHSGAAHMTMLAFYEACFGDPAKSVDAVGRLDPQQLPGIYSLTYEYIVTLLENLGTGGSFAQLNGKLDKLWHSLPPGAQLIPMIAWINNVCIWRAADLHGKKFKAFFLKRKLK